MCRWLHASSCLADCTCVGGLTLHYRPILHTIYIRTYTVVNYQHSAGYYGYSTAYPMASLRAVREYVHMQSTWNNSSTAMLFHSLLKLSDHGTQHGSQWCTQCVLNMYS